MNSSNQNLKRSALSDITNNPNDRQDPEKDGQKYGIFDEQQWFPIQPNAVDESRHITPVHFATQNVHPYLARYQHELKTDFLSHSDISRILAPDNELEMLHLLQETGVIANFQQCKYCGGSIHRSNLLSSRLCGTTLQFRTVLVREVHVQFPGYCRNTNMQSSKSKK